MSSWGHNNVNDNYSNNDKAILNDETLRNDESPPPDAPAVAPVALIAANDESKEESIATTPSPANEAGIAIPKTTTAAGVAAQPADANADAYSTRKDVPLETGAELRRLQEENRKLRERNEEQTRQNKEQAQQNEDQEEEARRLRERNDEQARQLQEQALQNQSLYDRNRNLEVLLRSATSTLPLGLQLLLLFLSGIFGYEPPIWLDLDKAQKWMGCRKPDATDPPPPTGKELFWFCGGLLFHILMFLVDFADTIIDFWTSIRESLGIASTDEDNPPLVGWAVMYFFGTAAGRILGGLLALFYHRIDKSDREMTYLLVELTIFFVEDGAAIMFLWLKERNEVELTQLDMANFILSGICSVVFVGGTVCRYRRIKEGLPRFVSCIALTFYALVILFWIGTNFDFDLWVGSHMSDSQHHAYLRIIYASGVLSQLCILYYWVRHLQKKEETREQQQQQHHHQQQQLLLLPQP